MEKAGRLLNLLTRATPPVRCRVGIVFVEELGAWENLAHTGLSANSEG